MSLRLNLVLLIALASPAMADTPSGEAATPPAPPEVTEVQNEEAEPQEFTRKDLTGYPKAVLVNLCIGLQSRVYELEKLAGVGTEVEALQERVIALEEENKALKEALGPRVPTLFGDAPAPAGSSEGVQATLEDDAEDKAELDPNKFSYKYELLYRAHYEYGGAYEARTRSARHLRDRVRVQLQLTNKNDDDAQVSFYLEACRGSGISGPKVLARSGPYQATIKAGGIYEMTTDFTGDNIAIATKVIRLADVELE